MTSTSTAVRHGSGASFVTTRWSVVLSAGHSVAIASVLFLIGCTTTRDEGTRNEKHVERLTHNRDWPRIEQIAKAEVKKRESAWPDDAVYLPLEHKDKVWDVTAMTATRNGDVERTVLLMIADGGAVSAYKRYWRGHEIPELDQRP